MSFFFLWNTKQVLIEYMCVFFTSKVENESNMLQDGSLIDLCGATLLWRTPSGLRHTPTLKQLESLRQELNAARPQCPVGFNTLAFPSLAQRATIDKKQPWVYMNCGHVHGYHNWGFRKEKAGSSAVALTGGGGTAPATTGERECPMCRGVGPYVPLWLGCEGGLYLDAGPPTHAFCPCGHVCSEKTVQGWSQIPLPHGTHAFHAACPFCGTWLTGEQGHIKLIFQGPVDWEEQLLRGKRDWITETERLDCGGRTQNEQLVNKARMTKREYTLLCHAECVNKSDEIKVENMKPLCVRRSEWKWHIFAYVISSCKAFIYIMCNVDEATAVSYWVKHIWVTFHP